MGPSISARAADFFHGAVDAVSEGCLYGFVNPPSRSIGPC